MLKKVEENNGKYKYLHFSNIMSDSIGEGICYVRGGEHRFTRIGKPFIVLYLQDVDGLTIPGYVFNVDNFKQSGMELTKAIHSILYISYQENYHPKYGMSIILDRASIVEDYSTAVLNKFVGTANHANEAYKYVQDFLVQVLKVKVGIPYTICTSSHMDYSQGELGGLAIHYCDMCKTLHVLSERFTEEERKQLWGTFVLYIYVHNNFLVAEKEGEADIQLVTKLTAVISDIKNKLNVGEGALEVVHMFFGYEPKDIFVRLIKQVSDNLIRASKEISMYKTLPISREGDAGYGAIRRYKS